jgi:D-lactate dehydrogenase (cytochrome)
MATTADAPAAAELRRALAALVGEAHVLDGDEDRAFFSQDVYAAAAEPAALVVQPGSVEELQRAVAAATGAGFAVVPRGGGASYTGGYLPDRAASVVVDTRRLDRIVTVDADDMYVTVECGVTWRQLLLALRVRGLRTPFWGPLSGAVATVGGSLSQNAVLWGSARHGVSAESVLGLELVLADGSLLATGSAATRGGRPFFRHYGPDLTGLFLGDTGALAVKARATLKLMPLPPFVETASFGFDSHEQLAVAMAAIARAGVASECFGMDPELQRQRMKRQGLAKDLKALKGVVTSARNVASGLKQAARVVAAGRSFLDDAPYSLHVGSEGRSEAAVRADLVEIRHLCLRHGGREVENTIPKVLRGDPFVSMTSGIGPTGERWLPVHGVVPLSDAAAAWTAVRALVAERCEPFARHGIVVGVLTALAGAGAFVLEPVIYWPGPRTLYYRRVLDADTLARFEDFPDDPEANRLVAELRSELTRLFLARGAAHFQIGRTYRYREGRQPEAWQLLEAVKQELDPRRLVNPGALGLD